jgi:hypothetical protein
VPEKRNTRKKKKKPERKILKISILILFSLLPYFYVFEKNNEPTII